jgi:hypothetical protein
VLLQQKQIPPLNQLNKSIFYTYINSSGQLNSPPCQEKSRRNIYRPPSNCLTPAPESMLTGADCVTEFTMTFKSVHYASVAEPESASAPEIKRGRTLELRPSPFGERADPTASSYRVTRFDWLLPRMIVPLTLTTAVPFGAVIVIANLSRPAPGSPASVAVAVKA